MRGQTRSFPSIDTWQRMSEGEQDAFIRAIEISRRRRLRLLLGSGCVAGCAAIAAAGKYALVHLF